MNEDDYIFRLTPLSRECYWQEPWEYNALIKKPTIYERKTQYGSWICSAIPRFNKVNKRSRMQLDEYSRSFINDFTTSFRFFPEMEATSQVTENSELLSKNENSKKIKKDRRKENIK